METGVCDQVRQLAAALLTGGVIGLWAEVIPGFQKRGGKVGTAGTFLWLIPSAALTFLVGRASGASLRLFFLAGVCGGLFIYWGTLHAALRKDLPRAQHYLRYCANNAYKNAVSNKQQFKKLDKNERK